MNFDDSRHLGDAGLCKLLQMVRRHAPVQCQNAARKVARDVPQFKVVGSPQRGLRDLGDLLKQSGEWIGARQGDD